MKKLLLSALVLASLSSYAQTKKVLLEDFTGDWCQFCPNGTRGILDLDSMYPATFLAVATHCSNGDPLEIADGVAIKTGVNVTGVPNGNIDRFQFTSMGDAKIPVGISTGAAAWKTRVASRLSVPAIVSVSFANTKLMNDGVTYEADVKVKFTSAPTSGKPLSLQVYIIENKIPAEVANGLAQTNSTTNWGGVNPITTSQHGFYHDHVLRQALGGAWGWTNVIPTNPTVGTEYTKHISFTLATTAQPAAWVKNNIVLYAFVAYNATMTGGGGTYAMGSEREVLNAEKVVLKDAFFKVGVDEVNNSTKILNSYPNPVKSNEVINTLYNLSESANVTFKVYNQMGQLVATPINNSPEVAGAHTIMWRASEHHLTPGTYIIEVSTPTAKNTQKIVIE